MSRSLAYSKQALKDAKKLKAASLKPKAEELLEILKNDPLQNPPSFEKLIGDLAGAYSRRVNIHNRLSARNRQPRRGRAARRLQITLNAEVRFHNHAL